jgi:hypothetical protein
VGLRHGLGGVMHGLPDCLYVNHPLANPNGQWGWIEGETGLPITAAFAELLQRGTS